MLFDMKITFFDQRMQVSRMIFLHEDQYALVSMWNSRFLPQSHVGSKNPITRPHAIRHRGATAVTGRPCGIRRDSVLRGCGTIRHHTKLLDNICEIRIDFLGVNIDFAPASSGDEIIRVLGETRDIQVPPRF
jgi:hypothetical protein